MFWLWLTGGIGLLLLFWPWRFTAVVTMGSQSTWGLFFWRWRLGHGRLRDLSGIFKQGKPTTTPSKPVPKPKKKPFSLKKMALMLWRDRKDLWTLMVAGNRTTLDLLGVLTRRFNVVVAGLDPMDLGWIAVLEAVRKGAGLARKIHVLNDWDPDAQGTALRWEIGFCAGEFLLFALRVVWRMPWKILWKLRKPSLPEPSSP
jgi:hypothetical protein